MNDTLCAIGAKIITIRVELDALTQLVRSLDDNYCTPAEEIADIREGYSLEAKLKELVKQHFSP